MGGFASSFLHWRAGEPCASFQLAFVAGFIELAGGFRDQAIPAEGPHFKAADVNPPARASWAVIGSAETPAVDEAPVLGCGYFATTGFQRSFGYKRACSWAM